MHIFHDYKLRIEWIIIYTNYKKDNSAQNI